MGQCAILPKKNALALALCIPNFFLGLNTCLLLFLVGKELFHIIELKPDIISKGSLKTQQHAPKPFLSRTQSNRLSFKPDKKHLLNKMFSRF